MAVKTGILASFFKFVIKVNQILSVAIFSFEIQNIQNIQTLTVIINLSQPQNTTFERPIHFPDTFTTSNHSSWHLRQGRLSVLLSATAPKIIPLSSIAVSLILDLILHSKVTNITNNVASTVATFARSSSPSFFRP